MDIKQIIKDNLPDGVEIGEKTLSIIAKEIKSAVGDETVPKSAYSKQTERIVDLESQISALEKNGADVEAYKSKVEALENAAKEHKANHEEEVAKIKKEFDDYKATVESEKTTTEKQSALRKHLESAGANPKLIGLLEKEFDISKIELDDEKKIKGWDDLLNPVKAAYAEIFGETKKEGAEIGSPPSGGGGGGNPFKQETFDLQAQTELFRKDPELARKMAASAGIILPTL